MRILISLILSVLYLGSLTSGLEDRLYFLDNSGMMIHEFGSPDTLIKMERTICFGTCPSYTLSILQNGKVTFNGREFVEHKGLATGEMSQENLDTLVQKIRESHFMDIPSNPECESRYTDHSSVFLTIELDDERNSLTHYLGCKGFQYEEELYELEEAIDSLSGANRWIE